MLRTKSLVTVLDVLGTGGLLVAGLALLDVTGFVAMVPDPEALHLFEIGFIVAVVAFSAARVFQIGHLMRTSIDPRRQRARRAASVEALPQSDSTPPVPNPFQRAA